MPYFHTSLKSSLQMSLQCLATQFLHFSFHTIIALKCQTLLFTIYLKILVQFGSVRVTRTFFSGKPNERRLRGLESISSKRKRRERAVGGQRRGAQKSSLLRQEMFEQFSVQCIYQYFLILVSSHPSVTPYLLKAVCWGWFCFCVFISLNIV